MKKRKVISIVMVLMMVGIGTVEPLAATLKNSFNGGTATLVKDQIDILGENITRYKENETLLLNKFEQVTESAASKLESKESEISSLKSQINELNLSIDEFKRSNEDLCVAVQSLTRLKDELAGKLASAERELEVLIKEKADLVNELREARNTIASQETEIASLKEQIKKLQKNDNGNSGNNGNGVSSNNGNGNGLGNSGNQGNGLGNRPLDISEDNLTVGTDEMNDEDANKDNGINTEDTTLGAENNINESNNIDKDIITDTIDGVVAPDSAS